MEELGLSHMVNALKWTRCKVRGPQYQETVPYTTRIMSLGGIGRG